MTPFEPDLSRRDRFPPQLTTCRHPVRQSREFDPLGGFLKRFEASGGFLNWKFSIKNVKYNQKRDVAQLNNVDDLNIVRLQQIAVFDKRLCIYSCTLTFL